MPKVSVIIPVYNSEKYLNECIFSILQQTYRDIELILVDDGSTDSSGEICKNFESRDSRVKYFYQENKGVSSARNEGVRQACGESIVFVDSDDFIKVDMIERLIEEMSSDFSMCGYELYDDTTKTISTQFSCTSIRGDIHILAQNIKDYLSPPYLLGPCFKMFRKDIIEKHNIKFPSELSYGEDAIFVLEYLVHCKTVNVISYIGYSYRKHGAESLSGKFLINKIDINYRINTLIDSLLQQEKIPEREQIVSDRLLECFVAYEKELVCSELSEKEKFKVFYEKYKYYKGKLGMPKRFAQRMIINAGNYIFCYPLIYLFKIKK